MFVICFRAQFKRSFPNKEGVVTSQNKVYRFLRSYFRVDYSLKISSLSVKRRLIVKTSGKTKAYISSINFIVTNIKPCRAKIETNSWRNYQLAIVVPVICSYTTCHTEVTIRFNGVFYTVCAVFCSY